MSAYSSTNASSKSRRSERSRSEPSLIVTPSFLEVIRSKDLREAFRTWTESNYCPENFRFYEAVETYKLLPKAEQKQKAQQIYEGFLTEGCANEVCSPSDVKQTIIAQLDNPHPETFDELQGFVFMFMRTEEYKKFLESPIYHETMGFSMKASSREIQSDPEDEVTRPQKRKRRGFFACGKVED